MLPNLANPASVLQWTMNSLVRGRISTKAAGQIIYAVQQLIG